MLALGIIGWMLIGIFAGWTANRIMGARRRGVVGNLLIGMAGGLIGGSILWLFGVDVRHGGIVFSAATCVAGACGLLYLVEKFTSRKA